MARPESLLGRTLRRIRVESPSLKIEPGTTGKIRLMVLPREEIVSDFQQRIERGGDGATFRLTDLRVLYTTGDKTYRLPLPDGVTLRQGIRLGDTSSRTTFATGSNRRTFRHLFG